MMQATKELESAQGNTLVAVEVEVLRFNVPRVQVIDHRASIGGELELGLVRVRSRSGLEGQCFVGGLGIDATIAIRQIVSKISPTIVGRSMFDHEWLWSQLRSLARHEVSVRPGWAAVDVALWDLIGKTLDRPIYELLGVARHRIRAYATHPPIHTDIDRLIDDVAAFREEGFLAYKFHPGSMPIDRVQLALRALRSRLDPDMEFMLDPANKYSLREAVKVGRTMDDIGAVWFEDPLPATQVSQMAELARRIDTPVAISDAVNFSLDNIAEYVRLGPFLTLRASSRWMGITGVKRACSVMEAFGGQCEIGQGGNPSFNAANLHTMMSVANCEYYEHWVPAATHEFGTLELLTPVGGFIEPTHGPGLGIVLDEDWIAAHRVA